MAGLIGGGGGGGSADYVQDSAPADPSNAEQWIDTSSDPFVLKMWNAVAGSWNAVATLDSFSALETEFNDHAADNSAHHTRPTETETTRVVGGYYTESAPATETIERELVVDEVSVTNDADAMFHFLDRSSIEITGGGTQTISDSYLTSIEGLFSGDADVELSVLSSPGHKHDIQP
jgi:hypothetical protein